MVTSASLAGEAAAIVWSGFVAAGFAARPQSTARTWTCARPGVRFASRLGLVAPEAAAGRQERGRRVLVLSVLEDDLLAGLAAAAVDDRGRILGGWHAPGASLERRRAIRLGRPAPTAPGDKAGCLFLAERRTLLEGGMLGGRRAKGHGRRRLPQERSC